MAAKKANVKSTGRKKDITKCFGLLKDYPEECEAMRKVSEKLRKEKWRRIR